MAPYNPYGVQDGWKQGRSFVYALCEPDAVTVRYIGKAQNGVRNRWITHMSDAKRGKTTPVALWVKSLLDNGQEPVPVLLAECPLAIVDSVERAWVHVFEDNGYHLLNVALVKTLVAKNTRGRQPNKTRAKALHQPENGTHA